VNRLTRSGLLISLSTILCFFFQADRVCVVREAGRQIFSTSERSVVLILRFSALAAGTSEAGLCTRLWSWRLCFILSSCGGIYQNMQMEGSSVTDPVPALEVRMTVTTGMYILTGI